MLKTFKKEQIGRCGCFFASEIKAIGVEILYQILTEIDKNKKKQILKTLSSFCVILERLGGLEHQRRSTRNKLDVRKAFLGNKRSFNTITSKCTDFSRFHAIFVKFLKISWLRTLITFNHERFRCSIGLFAEINAKL